MVFGGETFWRWLYHEDGALIHEISALMKEALESFLTFSSCVGRSEKAAVCEPGNWPSPDSESAGTLILNFLASRNVQNEFLLILLLPVCGILL